MERFDLTGKTALIIGGNGVLGSAIARGFAEHGAQVAIAGRDANKGQAVLHTFAPLGVPTTFFPVDVTDRASIAALSNQTRAWGGQIDILVNCAGRNSKKPFFEVTDEDWEELFAANAKSIFMACQIIGRDMVAQGHGSIINISSVSSGPPLSGVFAYSATKAAVNNMTQSLARELAPTVRVNALIPGFFPAEQNRKILTRERVEDIHRHTPLQRLGNPHELQGAAIWLASDKASGFVTGALIPVDGGFTAMTI